MFVNENVADASENAEIAINQLVANNYTKMSNHWRYHNY